jgi:hypothetical protein
METNVLSEIGFSYTPAMQIHLPCLIALFGASSDTPKAPQWYEQVSGILAIPVTLIGVAYSYVLIKKTSLEAKKTELEIREKLQSLRNEPQSDHLSADHASASASVISFKAGSLLLRYVLLELILTLSGLIREPLHYLFQGLGYGVYWLWNSSHRAGSFGEYLGYGLIQFGTVADSILFWFLFFILGWPLVKDILRFFGVAPGDLSLRSVVTSMLHYRTLDHKLRSTSDE